MGLLLLALATSALVGYTLMRPELPVSTAGPAIIGPPSAPEPSAVRAVNLLKKTGRPWTLAVLGDSTGDEPDEWVYDVTKALAARYDRPATIHNWSIDAASYTSATEVATGSGAPIEVWNGSAAGMPPTYSLAHLKVLEPKRPDLVIVSHGHNVGNATQAVEGVADLFARQAQRWTPEPGLLVNIQNPRLDQFANRQKLVTEALRDQYTDSQVLLADVWTAFEDSPRPIADLLDADQEHPNDAGEAIWTRVVLRALNR